MTSHDVPRDSGMHRGDIIAFIFQKPTIERISACTPRFRYAKFEFLRTSIQQKNPAIACRKPTLVAMQSLLQLCEGI